MMDVAAYLWLTLALGAGSIVKGATGMGLPLIALPALTAVFGLQQAIGVMLVPLIVTNAWQVWTYRAARHAPGLGFLPRFAALGVGGVALGSFLLDALPERMLVLGLGLILLGYVAWRIAQPDLRLSPERAGRLSAPMGFAAGLLQGATGVSGPIGVTFIHAMRLPRPEHVLAVSVMFLVFAAAQLPAIALIGIYERAWLAQGLFALVPAIAFMPLGERLARNVSRAAFDRLILAFLGLIGAKLALGL